MVYSSPSGNSRSRGAGGVGARRQRLSEQEVKDRVLRAARELVLAQGGLTVSLEHLNLEVVIGHADVPRSAVYRIWRDKEEFVVEFLCELARRGWQGTPAFGVNTLEVAHTVVVDGLDQLDTKQGRIKLMTEVIRRATAENTPEEVLASSHWRTYVALTATLASTSDSDTRTKISQALQDAEQKFVRQMAGFYAGMSAVLGVRLKGYFTWEHLAAAGAAVLEGLALRYILNPELVTYNTTIEGQKWSISAVGFLGVTNQMLDLSAETDYPELPQDRQQRLAWVITTYENANFSDHSEWTKTSIPSWYSADEQHSDTNDR
jgi:AcrR family transcriptional regulator